MKKLLLLTALIGASAVWTMLPALCSVSFAPKNTTETSVHGHLQLTGAPCIGEECPSCLTAALMTDEVTYYLTGLDEEWDEWFYTVFGPIAATVTGVAEEKDGYTFMQVSSIELDRQDIVSLCDKWHVLLVYFPDGVDYYRTYIYNLTTDTVINKIAYTRLQSGNKYLGAMRENDMGRIFYIPDGTTHEYLLYDFNVKEGDQLDNLWFGGHPSQCPYGFSATVKQIQESERKVFVLEVMYNGMEGHGGYEEPIPWEMKWIEGIGLWEGPVGSDCPFDCESDAGTSVLCAYKNGEQVYASEESEEVGCYYVTSELNSEPITYRPAVKQLRNGKLVIVLWDGREFDAFGKLIDN